MVPKRRRPPRLSGGGLSGPKAAEASMVPKSNEPPRLSGGDLGGPNGGGPLASAAGASVIPK